MSKILIVEDDIDLVETYTDLLEAKGYETTSASNAADAIELAVNVVPCLIILDLSLSGSSGTSVIDFIDTYKLLENTKIIVVTGHSEMTYPDLDNRVDMIMNKPFSNEQLLTIIARFLHVSPKIDDQTESIVIKAMTQTPDSEN